MTAELLRFAAVVLPFAACLTLVVVQAYGLARLGRRGEALVALLAAPVGIVLAYRAGLRGRAVALAVSASLYAVARLVWG